MRAAVLGSPIAHSLSPVLHTAGYAALGLTDWTYDRFELVAAELPGFLSGLDASWRGLSLTMPLKTVCLEVAEVVTDRARRAGVGNTLVRLPDGGWLADNTDVAGLVSALTPSWQPEWTHAAVLGAGATARSALLALAELGVREVTVYARTPAKAEPLIEWAPTELTVSVRPLAAWTPDAEPAVLSTLPAGAADDLPAPNVIAAAHQPNVIPAAHQPNVIPAKAGISPRLLFDAVYANWPTPLASWAQAANWTVVGGLDLLVHQAALQFELFTGHQAPIEAMFAAGRAALEQPK